MKAWLGSTIFEVTQKQLDKLNEIAEQEFRKTSDRAKGLQAAIDYCNAQKCPIVRDVNVIPSTVGEAGKQIGFTEMSRMIEAAVEKALAAQKPTK